MKSKIFLAIVFLLSMAFAVQEFYLFSLLVWFLPNPFLSIEEQEVLGIRLGTVGAGIGVATSFNIQYMPMFLRCVTTAPFDINIKVQGKATVVDLPAAGVTPINNWRKMGQFTNEYELQLANSFIENMTVTITITNQTAAAFDLDAVSNITLPKDKQAFVGMGQQQCQQGSGTNFERFAFLAFPAAGAADIYNVWMRDGTQDQLTREELRALLSWTQNPVVAASYNYDNLEARTKKFQVIPAATQIAYWVKYFPAHGSSFDTTLIAKG